MIDASKLARKVEHGSERIYFCVARHPEADRLFAGGEDFQVVDIDLTAEKIELVPFSGDGHTSYVTGATVADQTLVTGGYDRKLVWWDINSHRAMRRVDAHDKWIRRVIATPNGKRIISVADDMQCKVWDAETGQLVKAISDHPAMTPNHYPSMLYAVAVSADGQYIATGDRVGHVAVWNAETFEKVGEVEAPVMYTWDPKQRRHSIGGIRSIAFSPDGSRIAVGGIGTIGNIDHLGGPARLEVFDWQSGERLHELEDDQKKGLIEQIVWSADGEVILTAGGDHKGFLTFYNAESGERLAQHESSGHIHDILTNADLSVIDTVGHKRVERWSI